MKKYALYTVLALVFAANAYGFEFEIKGSFVSKPPSNKLYIHMASMMGKLLKAEPVDVLQNKFVYKGQADEPLQCVLSWDQKLPEDRTKSFSFILDKGAITIEIPQQGLPGATISGSKTNDELKLYFSFQKQLQPDFEKFNTEAQAASQKSKNIDSLRSIFVPRMDALQKRATQEQVRFIRSYPYSFISLLSVFEVAKGTNDFIMADSLYNLLNVEVRATPTAKSINEYIAVEKKISIGAIAPDFEQADANNKIIRLSSLRGKYVLLDFWASWCGPCRQENPNVVQAYSKFKDKGFAILGVSIDTERAKWLQAISDDGLSWAQVLDASGTASTLYHVVSIPSSFLINDKGVIVARNLRGTGLEEALKKFLKAD